MKIMKCRVLVHGGWPWNDDVKLLIKTLLVLPIGSAEAERAFSIMNHIRPSQRSRLQPQTLDATMRIRLNGPTSVEGFNAVKYAKTWISKGTGR